MPFDNVYFQTLVYSSLVFFNILMVVAIILVIYSITATKSIKEKTEMTLERIHDGASNLGEAGLGLASFVSQFNFFGSKRKSKKNPFASFLRDFFDRE
jgi:biopolymer transport protein ExbB/TolQ